jgi:hypothetical protein
MKRYHVPLTWITLGSRTGSTVPCPGSPFEFSATAALAVEREAA